MTTTRQFQFQLVCNRVYIYVVWGSKRRAVCTMDSNGELVYLCKHFPMHSVNKAHSKETALAYQGIRAFKAMVSLGWSNT